jgi:eukaryotic-like serine/threonine-protein kinase
METAWQVAAAIREAHARGIIHRDLKPSNVFVTHDANVKVLDFGLATRSVRGPDDSTSTSSSFAGSPRYMSPEQIRSSADVTPSTDVWSLGVLLFEMVTCKLPFAAANTTGMLAAIVADPATRLRELLPGAPADLDRLIADCLEKNAADRPSIEDVALRLEQLQARSGAPFEPEEAAGDSTLTSPPFAAQSSTLDRRPQRARLLLALVGGALLVALAGALSRLRLAEPVSAPIIEVAVRAQPPLEATSEAETLPPPVPIAAPPSPTVPVAASVIAARSSSAAIRALPRRTREDAVRDAISTRH